MRALMLEVPEKLLEDRRRKGLDHLDEMWEGVLHMVPPPSEPHQRLDADLLVATIRRAKSRGLVVTSHTGLFLADDSYRVPDLVFARDANRTHRGIEGGAAFVVEILSPGDESYEKLPFYEKFGVREALYVNPKTREFEFFELRRGRLVKKRPDKKGRVACKTLGVTFAKVSGPRLKISWRGGSEAI